MLPKYCQECLNMSALYAGDILISSGSEFLTARRLFVLSRHYAVSKPMTKHTCYMVSISRKICDTMCTKFGSKQTTFGKVIVKKEKRRMV